MNTDRYIIDKDDDLEMFDCGEDGVMIYLANKEVTLLLNWMSAFILEHCSGNTLDSIYMKVLDNVSYTEDIKEDIKNDIKKHVEELSQFGIIKILKKGDQCGVSY